LIFPKVALVHRGGVTPIYSEDCFQDITPDRTGTKPAVFPESPRFCLPPGETRLHVLNNYRFSKFGPHLRYGVGFGLHGRDYSFAGKDMYMD
jgi:hypothetical protein